MTLCKGEVLFWPTVGQACVRSRKRYFPQAYGRPSQALDIIRYTAPTT